MRIATWNVNSIRAREQPVLDWVRAQEPDILCMQETKVDDEDFPTDEFLRLGYEVTMAGQPTYNGVAIAARSAIKDVRVGLVGEGPEAEKRAISATVEGVRVVNVYVPNGRAVGTPTFTQKLNWLERLRTTLDDAATPDQELVLCGDFNVARDERDLFDPELFRGKVHFHPDERRALDRVLEFGLVDVLRHFHDEAGLYSWWDYRAGGFAKNQGLRIDYVFATKPVVARCKGARIDVDPRRLDKPSDHTPVVIELSPR